MKKENEEERNIPQETKEIFENFRLDAKALLYPFVFFLRRYFMILVLTILNQKMLLLQIHLHMLLTGFVIYYLIAFVPYHETY